jgi:hypothetical protein
LGLRDSCLEAVPQPRNLSQKVFIAASRREGCSNYPSEIMQGILGDRRSPSSALCKSAVVERDNQVSDVFAREGEDVLVACSRQEKDVAVDCLFW